jgi:hypothetical protein
MLKYPYEVPDAALRDLADAPAGSILVAEVVGNEWSVHVTKPEMFDGRRMVRLA